MDLRKLKTIFIFVLLIINAALGTMLYNAEGLEKEISGITRNNVEGLLRRDMIFLAPNLDIPSPPEIKNIYLEKMSADNEEFVMYLLRGKYVSDSEGVYRNGERSLEINGDEFVYKNSLPEKAVEDFSPNTIEKACRHEMDALGIKSELYTFGGINKLENGVRAVFTMQHDNDVFFDAYISFDVSNKGIHSISGKNLISRLTSSSRTKKYFNVSSILLELSKNPDFEKNKQITVMSIKHGYYIGRDTEAFRNILAIPVWQIVTDSGDILYYDARNGNYISDKAE